MLGRQKCFHAETASPGFFELGGVDQNWGQSFVLQNRFELPRDVRRDVALVDDNGISHEVVGFLGVEKMQPLPMLVQSGESLGIERSREYESGFVVERAQACVQVIAV